MGIASLLPTLKSISRPSHVGDAYGGRAVAVDAYVWLHRGAYACSRELCEGAPTRKHVDYFLNRARALRRADVRAIYVFDGGRLPGKANEEAQRQRNREEALAKAKEHARQGNASAAHDNYVRAVDVTPEMAREVIEALSREGFESLTAPYEADAQMAYLAKRGMVAGVITEDSDLIAHGCRSVFTKMGGDGSGVEIRFEELGRNRGLSFIGFTPEMFLEMCVLSGCDYLPSLNGVGVKKAHSMIRRFKTYSKVLRHMKFEGIAVPKDYESRFEDALLTFKYSWVYCPEKQAIVNLNDPRGVLDEATIKDLPRLIGVRHPPELARAVAHADVHPMTLEAFPGRRAPKHQRLAATAPVSEAPEMNPDDFIEDVVHQPSVAPSMPSKKVAAFEHFLREKPEDDEQSYRAAVTRRKSPARGAHPAQNNKVSFYAALNAESVQTPLNKRVIERGGTSYGDAHASRERETLTPAVIPDSVEKATPRLSSRLPKDISNVGRRVIAETPIAQSVVVKQSPYFTRGNTPKSDGPSYAKIAKASIDRIKKKAEAECDIATSAHKRSMKTPTRLTPPRAAKKARPGSSTSARQSKRASRKSDEKFWQMSLFESFAFEKK